MNERRQRIHELVVALLSHQSDLELLDEDGVVNGVGFSAGGGDPGSWLDRNRRIVQRYQALVKSAVTLDALIDQEECGRSLP